MSAKGSVRWTVGSYENAYDLLTFLRSGEQSLADTLNRQPDMDSFAATAIYRQRYILDRLADSLSISIFKSYERKSR